MDNTSLRTTFNEEALRYERARPHYPSELFDALVAITKLPPQAKLLEIGPGTGQATVPLAERGFSITAIELGHDLAKLARARLQSYPNVKVRHGKYEEVHFPDKQFDLVYAATAFHWIHRGMAFSKTHQLLKNGGHLAIIHTEHVSDESGDKFFHATHPVYLAFTRKHNDVYKPPYTRNLKAPHIDEKLFDLVVFRVFPVVLSYNTQEYIDLLSTFSPVISLPDSNRTKFLEGIAQVMDTQFGGIIEKHYAMTLAIAQKK